ncbi:hypothetical protein TRFO_09023 [Tritrichomonas foetus]|uniref:Importin subunit beta-1/Transportin-1-like TPR repeats domain-containing protein n=1 Tax=Tritrichomonas foetus TaxID=1144522 RepID=A0A1J4JGA4_9EUKA|nr:hypothetical protein TRFO_09023 [Tritrichomonas foetus]|eukprot:OHS98170.1 hypothetical protein TRFO_09023 [Tritrichomonas foetus]
MLLVLFNGILPLYDEISAIFWFFTSVCFVFLLQLKLMKFLVIWLNKDSNFEYVFNFQYHLCPFTKMDPKTSQLIQLFQALENPNPETRNPANETIIQIIQNDPMNFLFYSSMIVNADNIPLSIVRMTITLMGRAIKPSVKAPLDLIAATFMDPSNAQKRAFIKQAVFRGLMFSDQVIRQQASNCICILIQIEKDQWLDLFPALLSVASSSDYPIDAHCGAVYCFSQLLDENIPFEVIISTARDFYSYITQILNNPSAFSPALIQDSLNCFNSILKKIPIQNEEEIDLCLKIIQKNISLKDEKNVNCILKILNTLFRMTYSANILNYIQFYLEITTQILQEGDLNNQLAVIDFWDKIANFEKKQEQSLGVINGVAKSFFPVLLTAMTSNLSSHIENGLSDDDSFEEDEAYSTGCHCLSRFFKAAPDVVFECVAKLWQPENFQKTDGQIFALISITSIINKVVYEPLINFLEINRKEIFTLSVNGPQFISWLTLKLIQKALYHLNIFIRNEEDFKELMECLQQCSVKDPALAPECCYTIFLICKNENDNRQKFTTQFTSTVTKHFDFLWQFVNVYTTQSNTINMIVQSFDALCGLITITPDTHFNILSKTIESVISILRQTFSMENQSSEEVLYNLQLAMCSVITSIATKIAINHLDFPWGNQLIPMLFHLVKQKQTQIYEESLLAFSAVILCSKENYAPFVPETMDMLLVMLQTGSPDVIKQVIITLSDLFRNLKNVMLIYTDNVFKHLVPMVYNENFNIELIIEIVATLTDIMISQDITNPENRNELFTVLLSLLKTTNLNAESKHSRKFATYFFEIILYSFAIVISKSKEDEAFLSMNFNECFIPINMYINFVCHEDDSLKSFCMIVKSIGEAYKKRVQIKLNSRKITALLKLAKDKKSSNGSLSLLANQTMNFIHNL